MCAGLLGVSQSRTIPELMVWRFLQAFGSGAGLSVGSGVIGDIYKLEERYFLPFDRLYLISHRCLRGAAMGVFFVVGPYYLTSQLKHNIVIIGSPSWTRSRTALRREVPRLILPLPRLTSQPVPVLQA